MLLAIVIIVALIYLKERPQLVSEQKEKEDKPIQQSPPMGFDTKSKNFYSPLTTPVPNTYMKNPRIDPVPSIYNTVLNVDEKGRFDEDFFKKRQIYTNWDDMEEHLALDNLMRRDVPMTGGVLVNGLHKKEMVNPVSKYGMFKGKVETKLNEVPWM